MSSKYWIKLYHEILDDPKMGLMPDDLWRFTIELFLMAGEIDRDGEIPNVEEISWRLRIVTEDVTKMLRCLLQREIVVQIDGNKWCVKNFSKRQAPSSASDRMKKYRRQIAENEKNSQKSGINSAIVTQPVTQSVTSYVTPVTMCVTNSNPDTDTDTDTDIESSAKRTSRAKRDPKPKTPPPPSVSVYRSVAQRFPHKSLWVDIDQVVGDSEESLKLWADVIKGYIGRGWNPSGVAGMLDFFKRGEIPSAGGGGNGRDPEPAIKRRDGWCIPG